MSNEPNENPTPSSPEAAHAPRWRRRKEARPSEILAAALDIFLERGYDATRLEDIAKRAGCTKGTVFLYFQGKADLFKAAVREAMLPMIKASEQDFATHEGPIRDLLESMMRQRWEVFQRSRIAGLPSMFLADGARFPELTRFFHDEVWSRSQSLFARVIEEGIRRGEFRPMEPLEASRSFMAPLLLGNLWKKSFTPVLDPGVDVDRFFEQALDIFFRGIVAEPHREMA